MLGLELSHQIVAQRRQIRIVTGAQRSQRNLIPTGVGNQRLGLSLYGLGLAGTDRTVSITSLAEAATAAAATEQFYHSAVKDYLSGRYDKTIGVICLIQIGNHALAHHLGRAVSGLDGGNGAVLVVSHIVKSGNIHTLNLGSLLQVFQLALTGLAAAAVQFHQLGQHFLALTDLNQIKEIGHRLQVVNAGATGNDQRCILAAILGKLGYAGQIQHIQHAGIVHFILQGETQNIELADGIAAFQRIQGLVALTHLLLHIISRMICTLAPHAIHSIQQTVNDLAAQMAHADLVQIGKAHGKAQIDLCLVLDNGVVFASGIACGFPHLLQASGNFLVHKPSKWYDLEFSYRITYYI